MRISDWSADVCSSDLIKTDWSTRKLFSDELVLVSTTPRQLVRWDSRYVYIDWGDGYREQHFRAYPVDDTPLVSFSDARIALDYLLDVGGSAYLPRRDQKSTRLNSSH